MPSTKAYLEYVLDQLSGSDGVTYRPMMGEYIIYYRGKVIGGVYDDRFLVKPTKSAEEMMPSAHYELPYDGAKPMLLVEEVDDRQLLKELIEKVYDGLPEPRKKKK
ncbi:MAG: TfoX/Sxy family protein [Clostridia bacterium]|nr:TfoX/Sxy family protein [Clostridia bacterium]